MTFFDAILLGIVEGITEFLPISSTGHLILANSLLHITQSDFVKTFEIAIQSGAIAAVVAIYWKKFLDYPTLGKLLVGFVPTGLIGLTLYKVVKMYLLGNELVVVLALGLGGLALIVFEYFYREDQDATDTVEGITYKQALVIGLFQSLAIIPGVSRSAATIVGGLSTTNMKRTTIVEFSFLLAVPTLLAATGLDLIKNAGTFTSDSLVLLAVGFITSGFVAFLSIRFLLYYVRTHTFIPFGIYRIIVALVFFLFFLHT